MSPFLSQITTLDGSRRSLLTLERVFVLTLPTDLIPLGNDLGSLSHAQINAWEMLFEPRILISSSVRHTGDAFNTARQHGARPFVHDLMRGDGNGLKPG
jgi:hypothetical protein